MPNDIDSVIARVKKLQALADPNRNTSQAEVESAARLAEKLIQEYRLTQAQLMSEGLVAQEDIMDEEVYRGGRRLQWLEILLEHLCKHFSCSWYFFSGRVSNDDPTKDRLTKGSTIYMVIGTSSDWQVINWFMNYLFFEIDRLARQQCKGQGISVSNSFRGGAAQGVGSVLAQQREEVRKQQVNSTALLVLDDRAKRVDSFVKENHPAMRKGSAIYGGSQADARNRGFAAGQKIPLNKPLKG